MVRPSPRGSPVPMGYRRQAGFTYVGILFAVVIMGLVLTTAARVWSVTEQRERETQLLFVGDEFRRAIAGYYVSGHQYPLSLQVLLVDDRSPVPKRYLRRLYADPMTGDTDWTLIYATDGVGIMGVASRSKLTPLKRAGFPLADAAFQDSDCYCSWRFVYAPQQRYFNKPVSVVPGH
jgi:type II secretory pathway pseudopilin PulG